MTDKHETERAAAQERDGRTGKAADETPASAAPNDELHEQMPRTFEYLLNAMERAGQEANPAAHSYAAKRRAVFRYVEEMWDDYTRLLREKQDALTQSATASNLRQALAVAEEALEFSKLAINDWIHTYAAEFCDADDVARTKSRISERGGTLAYIGEVQEVNRKAIELLSSLKAKHD